MEAPMMLGGREFILQYTLHTREQKSQRSCDSVGAFSSRE